MPLGHDDVRECVHERDVRAGLQLQVLIRLDVRRAHERVSRGSAMMSLAP